MFNRNLLWPLLTALALFSITACTPEHRVEQALVTAPSGNTYYQIRFVNVQSAFVDSSSAASKVVLELPVGDFAAKAADANTSNPTGSAPSAVSDLPVVVQEGEPVPSDDPYIRFRQALSVDDHGFTLYYPEDAVSIRQFGEDLAALGIQDAVRVPPCTQSGRYFYAEVWFDLREGIEACGTQKLVLKRP
jgi:hypothetical protein